MSCSQTGLVFIVGAAGAVGGAEAEADVCALVLADACAVAVGAGETGGADAIGGAEGTNCVNGAGAAALVLAENFSNLTTYAGRA